MARTKKVKEVSMKIEEPADGKPEAIHPSTKKYSVAYTINGVNDYFVVHGDDYMLSSMDAQSIHTKEIISFPVIYVFDSELNSMEIIPMQSVGMIKHNWGVREEAQDSKNAMAIRAKEMKEMEKTKSAAQRKAEEDDIRHYQ